jgi:hypothetical protein
VKLILTRYFESEVWARGQLRLASGAGGAQFSCCAPGGPRLGTCTFQCRACAEARALAAGQGRGEHRLSAAAATGKIPRETWAGRRGGLRHGNGRGRKRPLRGAFRPRPRSSRQQLPQRQLPQQLRSSGRRARAKEDTRRGGPPKRQESRPRRAGPLPSGAGAGRLPARKPELRADCRVRREATACHR